MPGYQQVSEIATVGVSWVGVPSQRGAIEYETLVVRYAQIVRIATFV